MRSSELRKNKGRGIEQTNLVARVLSLRSGLFLQCIDTSVQITCLWSSTDEGGIQSGNIPILQGTTLTPSHQTLPIWCKPDIVRNTHMGLHSSHQLASTDMPYPDHSIPMGGCNVSSVMVENSRSIIGVKELMPADAQLPRNDISPRVG